MPKSISASDISSENCTDLEEDNCEISIDFIEVSECLDEGEYIDIFIGGFTTENHLSLELSVDYIPYFFDAIINEDSTWTSNFQIQGDSLFFIEAITGNSETGCSVFELLLMDLPRLACEPEEPSLLQFIPIGQLSCFPAMAQVNLYQAGTTILKHSLVATFDEFAELYAVNDVPVGIYDVYIKPEGCLQQGFSEIELDVGVNPISLQNLIMGDLDNSNFINIVDVSMVATAFNASQGDLNFNPQADFDCSGTVNIVDVSFLSPNFGQIGVALPED